MEDKTIENNMYKGMFENRTKKDIPNNIKKKTEKRKENKKINELLKAMKNEKKEEYKNKTYYLNKDIIKEIINISKLNNISESKIVNDLLKDILL